MYETLFEALKETLFMVVLSGSITCLIGIPLGIVLSVSKKGHISPNRFLYHSLNSLVFMVRSIPFFILMILALPIAHFLLGEIKGPLEAILPLSIAAIPYMIYWTAESLNQLPSNLNQVATYPGGTTFKIIRKVLLPESKATLIQACTRLFTYLVGFSVVAGTLGAKGLGQLAFEKGYTEPQYDILIGVTLLLFLLIQFIQFSGRLLAHSAYKR